jgi:hypothetical protein
MTLSRLLRLVRRGFFSVDSHGYVWRHYLVSHTGRWIPKKRQRADHLRADGYRRVRVQIEGKVFTALAHHLVWAVAGKSIPKGQEINHKNGERGVNRVSNLETTTKGGNQLHAYRELGRWRPSGENNGRHKLNWRTVRTIRDARIGYGELNRFASKMGVSRQIIRRIRAGLIWNTTRRRIRTCTSSPT